MKSYMCRDCRAPSGEHRSWCPAVATRASSSAEAANAVAAERSASSVYRTPARQTAPRVRRVIDYDVSLLTPRRSKSVVCRGLAFVVPGSGTVDAFEPFEIELRANGTDLYVDDLCLGRSCVEMLMVNQITVDGVAQVALDEDGRSFGIPGDAFGPDAIRPGMNRLVRDRFVLEMAWTTDPPVFESSGMLSVWKA